MSTAHTLLERALARFDEANQNDPNLEPYKGHPTPKEYVYAVRMTEQLQALYPNASEAVQLAVRAQHICRWSIPRADYPEGRKGYHQWRRELGKFHAQKAGELMSEVGYSEDMIERVRSILRKEDLRKDPETQQMEDIACLVFIRYYMEPFVEKYQYSEEKLVGIVQKTWGKMTSEGQQAALQLELPESLSKVMQLALAQ